MRSAQPGTGPHIAGPNSRGKPGQASAVPRVAAGTLAALMATVTGCTLPPAAEAEDYPSAARAFGWTERIGGHEFNDPVDFGTTSRDGDGEWYVWEGPGYQGRGRITRDNVDVRDGRLILTGKPDGSTGTAAYYGATQKHGRWEARVRIPSGDSGYTAVALLWPHSQRWPDDGEVNYLEAYGSGATNTVTVHDASGGEHVFVHSDGVRVDMRDWHTYAVEWTPDHITAYLDGAPVWTMDDHAMLPPGPMWHSFQVDSQGVGEAKVPTVMEVDWLRVYRL
ncbi:MAG: glycoside hydrolase family 16 protein [Propioniciclava sp.]|uniref:glycoside hydrolase family 16 protein n=1 Tax=Propioniciclava sp. TaxID=2038686 RepID=UPI0039E6A3F3